MADKELQVNEVVEVETFGDYDEEYVEKPESKIKTWFKKHGKKVAVAACGIVAFGLGVVIGKNGRDGYDEGADIDALDLDGEGLEEVEVEKF